MGGGQFPDVCPAMDDEILYEEKLCIKAYFDLSYWWKKEYNEMMLEATYLRFEDACPFPAFTVDVQEGHSTGDLSWVARRSNLVTKFSNSEEKYI